MIKKEFMKKGNLEKIEDCPFPLDCFDKIGARKSAHDIFQAPSHRGYHVKHLHSMIDVRSSPTVAYFSDVYKNP